jgi:hypothetical protein
MTTFRTTDISLTEAVRDLILDLEREDGSPMTPQTTVSAAHDVQAGDTTATVDDPAQFGPGMLFSCYDDSGEEDVPISQEWDGTNPVQLDFNLVDYPGFRFPHPAGTRVGTNLFTEVPNDIDAMLTGFAPLVYIVNLDQKDILVSGHQIEPVFSMHIEYRRALVETADPGSSGTLDTNLWGMRSQRLCRQDFEDIAHEIRTNTTLTTAKGEHCIALGDPQNPQAPRFQKQWTKIVVGPTIQHFAAMGDFSVRGFREVFFGEAFA